MSDDLREKREAEFGYREVSAREIGLRDWMFKRENAGFDVLVKRLQARNWHRRVYAEGGERVERMRANCRASHARRRANGKELAYRRARYAKNAKVIVCRGCGAQWCKAPWVTGRRREFCDNLCRENFYYATNEAFRQRKKDNARAAHDRKKGA